MWYQEQAEKTEAPITPELMARFHAPLCRILHGGIGLATESGEILDQIKKHIFYGKELDVVNLKEELGDILWYVALICNTLNVDMNHIMASNIHKLAARYPERFSEQYALNRDLDIERKILEQ